MIDLRDVLGLRITAAILLAMCWTLAWCSGPRPDPEIYCPIDAGIRTVHVVDTEGHPVAGATVRWSSLPQILPDRLDPWGRAPDPNLDPEALVGSYAPSSTTDATGLATFTSTAGWLFVFARAGERYGQRLVEFADWRDEQRAIVIDIDRTLTVAVVDGDGHAVPGAEVHVMPDPLSGSPRDLGLGTAHTDGRGVAVLAHVQALALAKGMPVEHVRVVAYHEGNAAEARQLAMRDLPQTLQLQVASVEPLPEDPGMGTREERQEQREVRVRLCCLSGEPVADAELVWEGHQRWEPSVWGTTGPDGLLRCSLLHAGSRPVQAKVTQPSLRRSCRVELPFGRPVDDSLAAIELPPVVVPFDSVLGSGRVVDAVSGVPVPASVEVVGGKSEWPLAGTCTDSDGRFELRGAAGDRFEVRVDAGPAFLPSQRLIQLGAEAANFVLERAAQVTVTVLCDEDRQSERVVVRLTDASGRNHRESGDRDQEPAGRWRFAFEGLAAGPCTIEVVQEGLAVLRTVPIEGIVLRAGVTAHGDRLTVDLRTAPK